MHLAQPRLLSALTGALLSLAVSATLVQARALGPAPLGTGSFSPAPASIDPAQKSRPKKPVARASLVHERVVARGDRRPSYHPGSLVAVQEAAARYLTLAEAGGWPILPADASLQPGSEGENVPILRKRLAAEGDLAADDVDNPVFDAVLATAVRRFQARHGQSQNALVKGPTLAALRVSAQARHIQLLESARRLARRNFSFGPRYVVVNIPSALVEAIENRVVAKRFVAVVGKKDRASPEVETRITNVNLNPTWTVPVSIIRKDIIPRMRKDPAYLAKARIRIYGSGGNEVAPIAIDWNTDRAAAFTLRQDAGASNALGQIRIDMPNRDAVYMHDTPSKRLFARDNRFQSSGCVRVENVRDFATWILSDTTGWNRKTIDAAIATGARKDIRPKAPVPVVWTYLTGFVTPDGKVHFRHDIYGLDAPTLAVAPTPASMKKDTPAPLDSAGLNARITAVGGILTQRIDP